MVAFIVRTHTKNKRQHTDSFNIQYLSHDGLWWWKKWSHLMLQKIQTLSKFQSHLSDPRQNIAWRSILQRSRKNSWDLFIRFGNADIHSTKSCNQRRTQFPHWKRQIKECISRITFNKAMLRNNRSVCTLYIISSFSKQIQNYN